MGSIGAYTFSAIHGNPPKLATMKSAPITRPGVDGEALWLLGKRGDPFALTSYSYCTSLSAAELAMAAFPELAQTVVTIVDDLGVTYYNMLVMDVTPIELRNVIGATQAGVTHILVCEWTFRHIWVA